MSRLRLNITMSLDGFVAGPEQSEQVPLCIGGEQLHEWLVRLRAFRDTHGIGRVERFAGLSSRM